MTAGHVWISPAGTGKVEALLKIQTGTYSEHMHQESKFWREIRSFFETDARSNGCIARCIRWMSHLPATRHALCRIVRASPGGRTAIRS